VVGLAFLKVAGLALIASYFLPLPPGVLFTLLNVPFFLLAGRAMGRSAMIEAIVANLLISVLARWRRWRSALRK